MLVLCLCFTMCVCWCYPLLPSLLPSLSMLQVNDFFNPSALKRAWCLLEIFETSKQVPSYPATLLPSYPPTLLPSYLPTIHSSTVLPSYLPTFLPSTRPSYSPTFLSLYFPTVLHYNPLPCRGAPSTRCSRHLRRKIFGAG